ncbi:MAG: hypothetical protein JJE36_02245 [Coriobacteriia bacterium]|nr:hypothetical protein [Coriobacteriia bacterium]
MAEQSSAEDGFTLVELLVTSIFMIFVITLVYQTISFAQVGEQVSARNNVMSGDVSTLLDIEDRFLSQNLSLTKSPDGYSYTVEVPVEVPAQIGIPYHITSYKITFTANQDGTFTALRTPPVDSSDTATTFTLSTINANVSSSTPLLELFYSHEATVTSTESTNATSAKITIVAKDSSDHLVRSSRTVWFRNRDQ